MTGPDLDLWLPDPDIRTCHRLETHADPATLWHAAETVQLDETRTLGKIVRWRIPDLPEDVTFRDLFRTHPFLVLDEGEGWSVSGLIGRIWTLERDYPRVATPAEFAAWDEEGSARVVFGHWVDGDTLHSEARAAGSDATAQLRLRALWAVVGRFERLIGGEALALAARRASPGAR